MADIVLYTYWRSSSSHRVRLALGAKKIPHRSIAVNLLAGEQSVDSHVARAPSGYIPALEIDGEAFFESVAIIELLEDLFPEPALYPKDPKARAHVRAMVETVNAGVQPLQNLNVLLRHSSDHDTRNEWARHYNERGMRVLEKLMEQNDKRGVRGRFAYGDTFTAADAFLIPQAMSAKRFGVDMTQFPRVTAAEAASASLPFVVAAAPDAQADAPK